MADKLTPFTFINSINQGRNGKHLLEDCLADDPLEASNPEAADKQYVPFVINRGMSYFKDTVLFANEMNIKNRLPPRMQYDFYRNVVSPKKRFSKWGKKIKSSEDIHAIKEYYSYSQEKAEAVYALLSTSQLKQIHSTLNRGGKGA